MMARSFALIAFLLTLGGCAISARLALPPNLYLDGANYPASAIAPELRTVTPTIFYVTDRMPETTAGVVTGYGIARSQSMAFGAATVRFGVPSWDELVLRTHVDSSGVINHLDLVKIDERVRFDPVPLADRRIDGGLRVEPSAALSYEQGRRAFQAQIKAEIARTGSGRILVYAHGIANDFDKGATTLANLWHFTGRRSVPIFFSWPSGNKGPLGYFRDRASGDFSVFHAKEMLTMLAEMPQVEDIDIVAHSRGTDIMTQALRELLLVQRGRGVPPKTAMKTGTLILAAADLDTGIFRQRLLAERFSEAFEQVNIYVNPNDSALRVSAFLTKSPRIGAIKADDFEKGEVRQLAKSGLIHFIRVEQARGRDSHSYFRANPAVLSDIVLALRSRAFPGGTLRPLESDPDGVWLLQPNYPLDRLPVLEDDLGR